MAAFSTYARYNTLEDTKILTDLFDQHSIPYNVEHEVNQLDKIYIGESYDPMFVVNLPADQFQKVTALLTAQATDDFNRPGFNHFFESFDTADLKEITGNPNDWNAYDVQIAKLLLQKENIDTAVTNDTTSAATYQPKKIAMQWIVMGYLLCLLTIAGIFFGLAITQAKKTLHNGETVSIYDKDTQFHGRNMVIAGSIFGIYWIVSNLMAVFYKR